MRFQILRLREEFLGTLADVERLLRRVGDSASMFAESARRSAIAFGRAVAVLGPGGDSARVSRRIHAARDALRVLSMDLDMLLALGLVGKVDLAPTKQRLASMEKTLENIARLARGAGASAAVGDDPPEPGNDLEGGKSDG